MRGWEDLIYLFIYFHALFGSFLHSWEKQILINYVQGSKYWKMWKYWWLDFTDMLDGNPGKKY